MPEKIIEIKNFSYSYPDGTKALSGINLDIYRGESVGIIGPNGAGKTTFLLQLNGILRGHGQIFVCGIEIKDRNLPAIRRRIGLVFQDPDAQLFMPTVLEDVAFGPLNMDLPKEEVNSLARAALSEVDMLDAKDRLAHHLSLGEKKRVSIATVLAMNPELLAMDEPTSNLDPKHRKNLITLINSLNHTKLIASHDLRLITDTCHRVIILDQGAIAADGKTEDILNNKELLNAYDLNADVLPYPHSSPPNRHLPSGQV